MLLSASKKRYEPRESHIYTRMSPGGAAGKCLYLQVIPLAGARLD